MKKIVMLAALAAVVAIGVTAPFDAPAEAKGIDCSIVLCPAPDCAAGTTPVILPGDCCFTCVPDTPRK